jgi:hypothetical protein
MILSRKRQDSFIVILTYHLLNEGLLREVMAKLESWMETQIYNSEGIILKGKER